MRSNFRRPREQDEEESVFVSMTDMTVSFLFIVILLLAYFASHFSIDAHPAPVTKPQEIDDLKWRLDQAECEINSIKEKNETLEFRVTELEDIVRKTPRVDIAEEYWLTSRKTREKILNIIRDALKKEFPNITVEISAERDALRFQDEGLFAKGESLLSVEKRKVVTALASRLNENLPFYTFGTNSKWNQNENPYFAVIEAIQIEGHTDSDGDEGMNLHLSTLRANATFSAMVQTVPTLTTYLNYHLPTGQPVLSVAGYGKMRPVADNETVAGKATNRRIDLRIIMHTPQTLEELDRIKNQLKGGAGAE
jgi:outer membrane protein OmpA-like peptidoglycan-associated protein